MHTSMTENRACTPSVEVKVEGVKVEAMAEVARVEVLSLIHI